MKVSKFDEKELNVVGEMPNLMGGEAIPIFSTPVSGKEGALATYRKRPIWQVVLGVGHEFQMFNPNFIPDNVSRAFVSDHSFVPGVSNLYAGKDMFGIQWLYEESAGGSMVIPGNPLFTDMNDWKEKVVWPDINAWDWEGEREKNNGYFEKDKLVITWIFTGFFERLISFMDFENAAVAMIDEEQEDAVKEFFDHLSDLYIQLIDKYITHFPEIDVFYIHDDWGAQKDTFFSPTAAKELLVPYMKKVTDFIHEKGRFAELHSCGMNEKQIGNIIDAGWDAWTPQTMNDTQKLYEEYGDQIIIGVLPDLFDPKTTSEEEQRTYARDFANKFCLADKPSALSVYAQFNEEILTKAYREELYKQSRINYAKS
ncbi:methyltransferase [Alkalibaculum sp. M08DMB]|uniref:Methyltransferase n=1 Tax=Alkalibaculum sporogenes TaxID=2655001 RepID=A0A6A7K4Y7_9FIRM|nr:uroporphyrinogen decarboxylase family protein [Alkalibaculum sporogenes]MPW24213.1 methyltransferase [Alkalibaculum sporogenes]